MRGKRRQSLAKRQEKRRGSSRTRKDKEEHGKDRQELLVVEYLVDGRVALSARYGAE